MASTETAPPAPEPEKVEETPVAVAVEVEGEEAPPEVKTPAAPPEVKTPAAPPTHDYFALADVVLRFLVFASAVVAVALILTSKQTHNPSPTAKFTHSPALIYFVAAVSVAGLYSIITTLLSFYALLKPTAFSSKVLSHFLIFDVVVLGIVAAATGAAGAIAYTGLKGNSHLGWGKICNVYDNFCTHVGVSVLVSLFASILLLLLVSLSFYSLSKKIPI